RWWYDRLSTAPRNGWLVYHSNGNFGNPQQQNWNGQIQQAPIHQLYGIRYTHLHNDLPDARSNGNPHIGQVTRHTRARYDNLHRSIQRVSLSVERIHAPLLHFQVKMALYE